MLWQSVVRKDSNSIVIALNQSAANVTFTQCKKKAEQYENHLNPVMLVFIGKLADYHYMSTHLPGLQSSFSFFVSFCIGKISHYLKYIRKSVVEPPPILLTSQSWGHATWFRLFTLQCWDYPRAEHKDAIILKNILTLSCWYPLGSSCFSQLLSFFAYCRIFKIHHQQHKG